MIKQLKILFFIKDSVPTPQDSFEASQYAAQVCFRNAAYIEDASEKCDGVAGAVPDCYKGFPKAAAAIAKYQAELKAFSAKLGDVAAPKKVEAAPLLDANGLKLGGPALEEYVKAGYPAEKYPPEGFAPVASKPAGKPPAGKPEAAKTPWTPNPNNPPA